MRISLTTFDSMMKEWEYLFIWKWWKWMGQKRIRKAMGRYHGHWQALSMVFSSHLSHNCDHIQQQ